VTGVAVAMGIISAGCGGAPPRNEEPPKPAELSIHVPCVLSGPMQKVVSAYESQHEGVNIRVLVDKPMAMLESVPLSADTAGVAITLGDREMRALTEAGAVRPADVVDIAVNTYPIVVVAAAEAIPGVQSVTDLTSPEVRAIAIEDPSKSSLGDRTETAFQAMGLWDKIAPKVVRLDPDAMVLGALLDGTADAAVIFRDCLFGESGGNPPKTIRIIGELPSGGLAPIIYQAAPLSGTPDRDEAHAFVHFLTSPSGREALGAAGLNVKTE